MKPPAPKITARLWGVVRCITPPVNGKVVELEVLAQPFEVLPRLDKDIRFRLDNSLCDQLQICDFSQVVFRCSKGCNALLVAAVTINRFCLEIEPPLYEDMKVDQPVARYAIVKKFVTYFFQGF